MSEEILKMAKTITEQEKQIEKLNQEFSKEKEKSSRYVLKCDDLEARIRSLKTEYGADYGSTGTIVMLRESLDLLKESNAHLISENQELHVRVDKAFGAYQMDKAAKTRFL